MSLADLAAFAVANNNTAAAGRRPLFDLTIEEARAKVKVRDGNKIAKEDGSVALTLALGKHTLSLDVVAKDATRINATKEKAEEFTSMLKAAVLAGDFDATIIAAQSKSDPVVVKAAAEKKAEAKAKADAEAVGNGADTNEPTQNSAPDGVDLSELDGGNDDELG